MVAVAWLPVVYGVVELISRFLDIAQRKKNDPGTFGREELNKLYHGLFAIHFYNIVDFSQLSWTFRVSFLKYRGLFTIHFKIWSIK